MCVRVLEYFICTCVRIHYALHACGLLSSFVLMFDWCMWEKGFADKLVRADLSMNGDF